MLKKTKYLLMILVAAYAATGAVYGQSSSTIGTEYWFGFMPNKSSVSERIVLVAASPTPAEITVQTYSGDSSHIVIQSQTYHLTPKKFEDTIGTLTIELMPELSETHEYELATYKAIHVSCSAPVSLSGYNYKPGSGEGMLILPVTTYGKEYRTINYPTFRIETDAYSGQFLIVSPYDDNVVTITTKGYTENSNGIESHPPGSSWQVTLQKGQTYLVRSSTKYSTNQSLTDLTGSHITSTKPVAVISGHEYTKIDDLSLYGSTFFEMLPPVESWSRRYYYDNYDKQRMSTVVFVAADSGEFWYRVNPGNGNSTPVTLNVGERSEETQSFGAGLFAVSATNSRFLACELRRSISTSPDNKKYPPSMTLLTSPDNKDNTVILNYPPLFDPQSENIAEETIYHGRDSAIFEVFPGAKIPDLDTVPVQPYNHFYRTSSGYVDADAKGIFHRKPLAAMITGTSGTTSFGHTSSLVYTKRSLDNKYPYLTSESLKCGNYIVAIADDIQSSPAVQESGKLASVRIITDEHDITQLPPIRNYRVVRESGFVFGAQRDTFKLEVINPAIDAYAAVYIQDLAGNDTTYVFSYKAGSTILGVSKATNTKVPVGMNACWTIPIFPKGDTSSSPILVESIQFKSGQHFDLSSTTPTLPHIFDIGDTLLVSVCTFMPDTVFAFSDSLLVFADCRERAYSVMSKGATGLLFAPDASFSDKKPNQKYSTQVRLENKGEIPLWVTSYQIEGSSLFKIATGFIPKEIPKKGFQIVDVYYEPTEYGVKDSATIFWKTDVNAPYENSIKTFTILTGSTTLKSGVSSEANTALAIHSLTPNPAKDYIQLRYFSASKITMTVTNELGNEALKFELMPSEGPESSTRINLPQLPNGSYTLRLQNSGGEVASRRFVVAR